MSREVKLLMSRLAPAERMAALAYSALECDPHAAQQVQRLALLVERMGRQLPQSDRIRLASLLIDVAAGLVNGAMDR